MAKFYQRLYTYPATMTFRLKAWFWILISALGVASLFVWNYTQLRKQALQSHQRWVERLVPMIVAEQPKYLRWIESVPGRLDAPTMARQAPYKVVALYLADMGLHKTGRWTLKEYRQSFNSPDPRLVELQLRVIESGGTQAGPMFYVNGKPFLSVVRALDRQRALAAVIEAPEIRRILEEESRLWGTNLSLTTKDGMALLANANTRRSPVPRFPERVVPPFLKVTTVQDIPEFGWTLEIVEPIPNLAIPMAAFAVCFLALLLLARIPWQALDAMRKRKTSADLAVFGAKVDKFIRGKDAVPPEPPVPYGRELGAIIQALKWMMPQWKKAEQFPEELGLEKRLLQLLVESLPEGILFFNAQGGLQLSNELGRVFLGMEVEKGKEFKMVSGKQIPRGFLEPYVEPVFTGAQSNHGKEVDVKWADGKHLYRIWVEAVEAQEGRVDGYMVVVRDITFRRQWEHVQEQVLSGITHDLRGPLSAVMGYLDLLKRQQGAAPATPPKAVEYVKLAKEAAVRLNQMVSDILDVVRFEQGKIELAPEAIPLTQIFDRLKNIFSVQAEQKGVKLALVSHCPSNAIVHGDPKLLERVFDNLVSNAVKFTPTGGTITVAAAVAQGRKVISVSDTGRGIPKEAQSRIFDKFQQVRPGDRSAGYGLGLAVSKFIVEAHKGEIRVESEIDQGSTFTFWIPDAPTGAGVSSPTASPGESSHS